MPPAGIEPATTP